MTVKKCRELTESKKIKTMDTIGQSGDIVLKKMRHSKFDYIIGNPPYAPLGKNVSIEGDAHFVAKVKSAGSNLFVAAIYRAFELAKRMVLYHLLYLRIFCTSHHIRIYEKFYLKKRQ